MSFGLKKAINTSLRGIGVKTFDAAAVTALAEYIEKEGSEESLKDFVRVWKSGLEKIWAWGIYTTVDPTTHVPPCRWVPR
jgi:hypothetical protein